MFGTEDNLVDGIISVFTLMVGWLLKSHNQRLRGMEDSQRIVEKDLSDHKLYAEKVFVKETTLARIHEGIDELRDDVKTLIKAVAEK